MLVNLLPGLPGLRDRRTSSTLDRMHRDVRSGRHRWGSVGNRRKEVLAPTKAEPAAEAGQGPGSEKSRSRK